MGGSTKTTNQQTSLQNSGPWAPAVGPAQDLLNQITGQLGNTAPTDAENAALSTLESNAQAGNPYAGQIGDVANTLLNGGGPDYSGRINDAFNAYQQQTLPWLSSNPASNPAWANISDLVNNDVANNVNGMFAAAGRDLSGANQQAYGRGVAQGLTPYALQAQQQALNAENSLYNAGNTTTGLLSNLDQTRLANEQAGIGAANAALGARDYGANATLAAEAARRNLPLQNIAQVSNLLQPLARLGSSSSGSTVSEGTSTAPLLQQLTGAASDLGKSGLFGALSAFLSQKSDARVKDNITPVGALYDGTPVHSFTYIGDPTPRIGLLAQQVEQTRPDAVHEINGIKTVDYGRATENSRGILGNALRGGGVLGGLSQPVVIGIAGRHDLVRSRS